MRKRPHPRQSATWRRSLVRLTMIGVLAVGPSGQAVTAGDSASAVRDIEVRVLDADATGYGTFQSHNQKVAIGPDGIFATHIRSRNEAYTAQTWRLSRTTDLGESFETIDEATEPSQPPPIEIDREGRIYLARVNFTTGDAFLNRYDFPDRSAEPTVTRIPGGAAGKYSLCLDEPRGQLYLFSHNNTFHVVGMDGTLRRSTTIFRNGPNAICQYPQLSLAGDGTLVAGWTTQKHGIYLYWDIHAMKSPDGGTTWTTLAGEELPVPMVVDDTGPTDRISADDEFEAHTWLSNMTVTGSNVHFFYEAQTDPMRMHYLRFDLSTGKRDLDRSPEFAGDTLKILSLDGYFTSDGRNLFAVSSHQSRLVCLISRDEGQTWSDFAAGPVSSRPIYAVGGCRRVSPEGWIVGTYTEMTAGGTGAGDAAVVHFFRIQASNP